MNASRSRGPIAALVLSTLAACGRTSEQPDTASDATTGDATTGDATTGTATSTDGPTTTTTTTDGTSSAGPTSSTSEPTTGTSTGTTAASGTTGGGVCTPGDVQGCYSGPDGTQGVGVCVAGQQTCDDDGAAWGPCVGEVLPAIETCATPDDDDCDMMINEDGALCVCAPNSMSACYSGPMNTEGVGNCAAGTQLCDALGTSQGPCTGEVLPQLEDCATPEDEDCDDAAAACTGGHLWSKRFGNGANQEGFDVATDGADAVVVVGTLAGSADFGGGPIASAGLKDAFVARYDATGKHLWSKGFGDASDQSAFGVATDGAGNVIVTGSMAGTVDFGGGALVSAGQTDIFVAKFDPAGKHLWSKRFGALGAQVGAAVAVDPADHVIVTGHAAGAVDFGGGPLIGGASLDVVVAKLDPTGAHVWSKRFGDMATDQQGLDVATDADGDVLLTGAFAGALDLGGGPLNSAGSTDIFVARLDAAGAHAWSKRFGDAAPQLGRAVARDGADSVLVTGELGGAANFGGGPLTSAGSTDIFVVKLDAAGAHVWSKRFGDANLQYGHGVAVDPFDNVVLIGHMVGAADLGGGPLNSAGMGDVVAAKFTPAGAHVWSKRFGDAAQQGGYNVATDGGANLVVTGWFNGTIDFGGGALVSAGGTDGFLARLAP